MSLWFIKKTAPALTYNRWQGSPPAYNQWLVEPPRIYREALSSILAFYYVPGVDRLVGFAWFDYCFWPGWLFKRLEWNAGTGEALKAEQETLWGAVYTNGATTGSYGSVYACRKDTTKIYEVNWQTLTPQGWVWTPPVIFTRAVVNREDDRVVGIGSWYADTYRISDQVKIGSLRMPGAGGWLTWESRKYLWGITANGVVLKMNYRTTPPRWELLTSVQNPSPEARGYLCAFDTLRNRLAVLRWLPDAADGACRLELEFYRPLVKVAADGLTQPVPLTEIAAGQTARFVAHLHGEQGEGLGAYYIDAALADPAVGNLVTTVSPTLVNGAATFSYMPPLGSQGQLDTLRLSAHIEQDEQEGR
jgi:hypothetical protein